MSADRGAGRPLTNVWGLPRTIEATHRQMLRALLRRRIPPDRVTSIDIIEILAHLANALRREVGVLADRHGAVGHVILSRRWQPLVEMLQHRATGPGSGLRYLEVHPHASGTPDGGDRRVLDQLVLDLVATAGTQRGHPTEAWLLVPARTADGGGAPAESGPYTLEALAELELMPWVRAAADARRRAGATATAGGEPERAILVGLDRAADTQGSLEELARLAETAGAKPVATVLQHRTRPDPGSYVGRGKVEEVLRAAEAHAADVVLIDEELSPAQQRTLERDLGVKVLDRTALVLDIFARRARSREGRLQVELAQMNYVLPRLAGRGVWLSRLGGGIGTRGPGETKLEVDRRRVRERITRLQREIDTIQQRRVQERSPREAASLPQVALVGYTNAGKSTLLNALTGADAFVEDRLFATLDPMVRRLVLPSRRPVVLADTVGFIQRLPTQLVAAFRGTLEEVTGASLLVHVIDASHPAWEAQGDVVRQVLAEIGAGSHPVVTVFNKADLLPTEHAHALAARHLEAVVISAARRTGLSQLLAAIDRALPEPWIRVRVEIPYSEPRLLAQIYREGRVLSRTDGPGGVKISADVPGLLAVQLRARAASRKAV